MINRDTDSLKYILEEMDPAEKIEFERVMTENPDLHIEVESIRRMKKKLSHLPDLAPPEELTDSILELAAEKSASRSSYRSRYFLSAAVMILGLTTGSLLIQNPFDSETNEQSRASTGFSSVQQPSIEQRDASSSLPASTKQHKPWVDRSDVIHLNGFENGSYPANLMDTGTRFDKLRPVGRLPSQQPFSRSLQLTGSNR